MTIVQLMASPFIGGPEQQILGLAKCLQDDVRTVFVSFAERGLAKALLHEATANGFEAIALAQNFPNIWRAADEIAGHLQRLDVDVVCCNGYKPDIIGLFAARRAGVPVVSISHGWTAASWKVRCYESFDRMLLRQMDAVVCVSSAQAKKVRRAGVPSERTHVIRNAIGEDAFVEPDARYFEKLHAFFPRKKRFVIGAAGRLSPEKGFDQLLTATQLVVAEHRDAGVVIFGDGPLRNDLKKRIAAAQLHDDVILAGFHANVQRYMPYWDVAVLSSYTEGLPVFVLEAMAAGVPVVATAVGGTPEVVAGGETGFLVTSRDAQALAERIGNLLANEKLRAEMGRRGRERVRRQFSFKAQCQLYRCLFDRLCQQKHRNTSRRGPEFAAT